jgi:hypothetical protein
MAAGLTAEERCQSPSPVNLNGDRIVTQLLHRCGAEDP